MKHTFTVPLLTQPTRLDKFVHEALPEFSRTALQQAIKRGAITVNGKRVTVHHFLKADDRIDIQDLAEPKHPAVEPNPQVAWRLVEETPDYLIVEKPSGLVVHPAEGVKQPTLVDGLLARFPELAGVGEDPLRPGIVHRLDREVSGLMVVARNQAMYQTLKQQFQARTIEKQYTALVVGRMTQPSGTINFPLARSKRQHGKMAARAQADEDTREAVTHYTVVREFQQVTLLKVKLETGRTHQIRAHLAALGYPLVGDQLYRPKKLSLKASPGRIFLHASALTFTDLTGAPRSFVSELPPDLHDFLSTLS